MLMFGHVAPGGEWGTLGISRHLAVIGPRASRPGGWGLTAPRPGGGASHPGSGGGYNHLDSDRDSGRREPSYLGQLKLGPGEGQPTLTYMWLSQIELLSSKQTPNAR